MLREMGRRAARVGEGTRRAVQSFRPVTRIVPDDWGSRPGGTDARQRDEPERCHSRTQRVVPQNLTSSKLKVFPVVYLLDARGQELGLGRSARASDSQHRIHGNGLRELGR